MTWVSKNVTEFTFTKTAARNLGRFTVENVGCDGVYSTVIRGRTNYIFFYKDISVCPLSLMIHIWTKLMVLSMDSYRNDVVHIYMCMPIVCTEHSHRSVVLSAGRGFSRVDSKRGQVQMLLISSGMETLGEITS